LRAGRRPLRLLRHLSLYADQGRLRDPPGRSEDHAALVRVFPDRNPQRNLLAVPHRGRAPLQLPPGAAAGLPAGGTAQPRQRLARARQDARPRRTAGPLAGGRTVSRAAARRAGTANSHAPALGRRGPGRAVIPSGKSGTIEATYSIAESPLNGTTVMKLLRMAALLAALPAPLWADDPKPAKATPGYE